MRSEGFSGSELLVGVLDPSQWYGESLEARMRRLSRQVIIPVYSYDI